jgi:hypothetical protein
MNGKKRKVRMRMRMGRSHPCYCSQLSTEERKEEMRGAASQAPHPKRDVTIAEKFE